MTASPAHPVMARDLTKSFASRGSDDRVVAVDDVSLEVPAGTMTAIVGPSGSGKSTLLHLLAGLERPDRGSALIDGVDVTRLRDRRLTRLRRERIGFVFQSYHLLPHLTAAQNIELPLRLGGVAPDGDAISDLAEVLGITDRLDHLPAELSGGQQQRVAVARALVTNPAVVFADEPTGALDDASARDLLEVLRLAVDQRGQTLVVVTHDDRVRAVADRVVHMDTGRLVDDPISGPTDHDTLVLA